MPDDIKHFGRKKHDRQGMLLGMIGALGLMLLIHSVGIKEDAAQDQCERCHSTAAEDRLEVDELKRNNYVMSVIQGDRP